MAWLKVANQSQMMSQIFIRDNRDRKAELRNREHASQRRAARLRRAAAQAALRTQGGN